MKILEGEREILSNDTAVLAGAIVSRANTLITKDDKLKKDFKKCASINRNTSCKHRIAQQLTLIEKSSLHLMKWGQSDLGRERRRKR